MATSTDRAPSMDRFDAPAAALVVVLGGLYVLSLARSDSTILGHSFLFEAVIVTTAIIITLGAAYFALTEFFFYGSVAILLLGLAFLLLSAGNATMGLVPLLAGWQMRLQSAQLLLGDEQLVAGVLLVAAGLVGTRTVPQVERRRWTGLSVAAALALSALAALYVYVAGPLPAGSQLLQAQRLGAGILYLTASALFWYSGKRYARAWFIWLSLNFCVGGFAQLLSPGHAYVPHAVQLGDLLRLVFFAGILLGLVAEWGRGYRLLRTQTRELEVLHSLMTAPNLQNIDDVVRHIARVVGDALRASVEVVVFPSTSDGMQAAQSDDDGLPGSPNGEPGRLSVALEARGRTLGRLMAARPVDTPFTAGERRLLWIFSAQAASLVDRSLLYEEMAAGAILEERSRLAREIHDGLAQHLAFLKMRVTWLKRASAAIEPDQLQDIEGMLTTALAEARQAITTLRSGPIAAAATEAVQSYAAEFSQVSGLRVVTECREDVPDVGPRARVELLRIVQEALNNVRKHANASAVWIVLENDSGGLGVQIVDDGAGFHPENEHDGHFGTEIMRERAESIGGSLLITSLPGQGTRVSVWVPAGEEQARLERAPS